MNRIDNPRKIVQAEFPDTSFDRQKRLLVEFSRRNLYDAWSNSCDYHQQSMVLANELIKVYYIISQDDAIAAHNHKKEVFNQYLQSLFSLKMLTRWLFSQDLGTAMECLVGALGQVSDASIHYHYLGLSVPWSIRKSVLTTLYIKVKEQVVSHSDADMPVGLDTCLEGMWREYRTNLYRSHLIQDMKEYCTKPNYIENIQLREIFEFKLPELANEDLSRFWVLPHRFVGIDNVCEVVSEFLSYSPQPNATHLLYTSKGVL